MIGKILLYGGLVVSSTLLIPYVGFGTVGIAAKSSAAVYQSSVGTVAAGSFFSTL